MKFADVVSEYQAIRAAGINQAERDEIRGLLAALGPEPTSTPQPTHGPDPVPTPEPVHQRSELNVLEHTGDSHLPMLGIVIEGYCDQPTAQAYFDAHIAIEAAWRAADGAIGKDVNHNFLRWLITQLEDKAQQYAPPLNPPLPALQVCLNEFREARLFACEDINAYGSYANGREWLAVARNRFNSRPMAPPALDARGAKGGLTTAAAIISNANKIRNHRATECYGFVSVAAAAVLDHLLLGTITIETVGKHNFATYTPAGGGPGCIIDLWLGAVGRDVFYPYDGGAGYPFSLAKRRVDFTVTRRHQPRAHT